MRQSPARWIFTAAVLFLAASGAAYAQLSVTSDLSQLATLRPGQTFSGSIVVANRSRQPESLRFFVRDYLYQDDGSDEFHDPGVLPHSNAPWLTLHRHEVLVAPGKRAEVRYTVAVPSGERREGTFWSLIMYRLGDRRDQDHSAALVYTSVTTEPRSWFAAPRLLKGAAPMVR